MQDSEEVGVSKQKLIISYVSPTWRQNLYSKKVHNLWTFELLYKLFGGIPMATSIILEVLIISTTNAH